MTYLVTAELLNGGTATVSVNATCKSDAEYRGAYKIETTRNAHVVAILVCRKAV